VNNTVARVAALLAVAIVGLIALRVFDRTLVQRLTQPKLLPAVRSTLLAQEHRLGDVPVPSTATVAERGAVAGAVAAALATSRWTVLLAAAFAAAAGVHAGLLVESAPTPAAAADAVVVSCGHPRSDPRGEPAHRGLRGVPARRHDVVHLRVCLFCGHVGCCDSSRGRHATSHFWATEHPVVRSLEEGEDWRWCYVDDVAV
jgi:hypothetical protein